MSRNGLDCPGIELFSKNTVLGPPFEFISKIKFYENTECFFYDVVPVIVNNFLITKDKYMKF
jgi:hypothetical protein